ncbi:hypothetical protein J4732_17540 [Serratia marcescens]|uniref:Histidine kinase n=1 Tax=Serratia marcescens TaxID=615 RepID=A0A939SUU7_SERMA|nr:hypothetical protein [Serratia marcescens]
MGRRIAAGDRAADRAVSVWWIPFWIADWCACRRVAQEKTRRCPKWAAGNRRSWRRLESMRLKLEGKAYIEQYAHTLTHELKSPLAAIRARQSCCKSCRRRRPPGVFSPISAAHASSNRWTNCWCRRGWKSRPDMETAHRDRGAGQPDGGGQEAQATQRGVRLQLVAGRE